MYNHIKKNIKIIESSNGIFIRYAYRLGEKLYERLYWETICLISDPIG